MTRAEGSQGHARDPLVRAFLTRATTVDGRWRPEYNFPMPNDTLVWYDAYESSMGVAKPVHTTVIASIYYIDDEREHEVLVLLLRDKPWFFEIGHLRLGSMEFLTLGRFENIVPAVDAYKQNGGDY